MGIQKRRLVKKLFRLNDELLHVLKEMHQFSSQDEKIMKKYAEVRKRYCTLYKALKMYDRKYYKEGTGKEEEDEEEDKEEKKGENATEEDLIMSVRQ